MARMLGVFLSHTFADKVLAKRLRDSLEAHGFRVWLDEAEIQVGDSLIDRIGTAIGELDYLAVILTPESVASEWVRTELRIAMDEEIRGRKVKVLPLLFRQCTLPPFLTGKLYADFTRDYAAGLAKLLERLTADLHDGPQRRKRAMLVVAEAYQTWVAYGQSDHHLLEYAKLADLMTDIDPSNLSSNLLEYVGTSLAIAMSQGHAPAGFSIGALPDATLSDLHRNLMAHPTRQVRRGLVRLLDGAHPELFLQLLSAHLATESDATVRRDLVEAVSFRGRPIPEALANAILSRDDDWIVKSHALRSLARAPSVLLLSDGTRFAIDLGSAAERAGFRLVVRRPDILFEDFEGAASRGALNAYDLLIVVRGEGFRRPGPRSLYAPIFDFLHRGGSVLFTSWAAWETANRGFASILPVEHLFETYNENVAVTALPRDDQRSRAIFSGEVRFRGSYEILKAKPESVVWSEMDGGIPLFADIAVGSGRCYYLNVCQHDCRGPMPSPLEGELVASLERMFAWLHDRLNEAVGLENPGQSARGLTERPGS